MYNALDINECEDGKSCHHNVSPYTCQNTEGSYTCGCENGYRMQNNQCVDKNECVTSEELARPCPLNSQCSNNIGGFECKCNAGYIKSRRGNTCQGKNYFINVTVMLGVWVGKHNPFRKT